MPLHVDVWSDFICPWCYLVSTSLEKLKQSHGVSVSWKSYELRPKGSPPPPQEYVARIKAMEPQFYAMAKSQYGITINRGPYGINSRPALIGMKYAEEQGKGDAYHHAVFYGYWEEARNIEDTALLAELAVSIGLDGTAFLASLKNPVYDALVDDDVEKAYRYELRGVPALIFENKFYIPGAQPYDELVRFVEQIERRLETTE